MESNLSPLANSVRSELLHLDGVTRFSPNRRFATVFTENQPAETLFFVESGLVKLYKRGPEGKEIIIDIVAPGHFFGEQAVAPDATRSVNAEILSEGVVHVIPRELFVTLCNSRTDLWRQLSELLLVSKKHLEKKIELLCLQDVEHRIMYYLRFLAASFGARLNVDECAVSLSQGELASLIGATRETTSTTLNALARRGLIKLGRRQLIVIFANEGKAEAKAAAG